jgi:hypothetical protein
VVLQYRMRYALFYIDDNKYAKLSRNDWTRRYGATCSYSSGVAVSLHHRGDLCRC